MNKILAVSVLLGVTAMMMGSILPVMAEPTADQTCPKTDPNCEEPTKDTAACEKIRELINEGKIPTKVAKQIFVKVCAVK